MDMKKLLCTIFMAAVCLFVWARPGLPTLEFDGEGRFKIVQFTDIHYRPGDAESDRAVEAIVNVLDYENPDLVIFTGDLVWDAPSEECFEQVLRPVIERKIPWAFVPGNHDDEFGWSRAQIMEHLENQPFSLTAAGPADITGYGNYIREIRGRDGETAALLYFMDSGSYENDVSGVGKSYGWFACDQIGWYRENSVRLTGENGGRPYPALAFFHIPVPEYGQLSATGAVRGSYGEKECSPLLNTGMFSAMKLGGDVMGIFVGHDHDNDYIGNWMGIALAYGRYTGGNTVYNNLGDNGARVIVMREGERAFDTYIRLGTGAVLHETAFPGNFNE